MLCLPSSLAPTWTHAYVATSNSDEAENNAAKSPNHSPLRKPTRVSIQKTRGTEYGNRGIVGAGCCCKVRARITDPLAVFHTKTHFLREETLLVPIRTYR